MAGLAKKVLFSFNGLRITSSRRSLFVTLLVIICILTLPFLYILNITLYSESYKGMIQLDDDFIADYDSQDPRLIDHIRKHYLIPPTDRSEPYNLNEPDRVHYSQKKQSMVIDELLHNKRNGFFIEAGAYDGETYSNSLYFEKYLNWTGLLVEPDYANLKRLMRKKRKAWVLKGCLEGSSRPKKLHLYAAMEVGVLEEYMTFARRLFTRMWRPTQVIEVWCFPLLSVMTAINQMHADYFVLDVEGAEMSVLKGLPLDKLDITVMQIEYSVFSGAFWDREQSRKRLHEMRQFMKTHFPEYTEFRTIALDIIYVKEGTVTF
ncbi:Protein Star [Trichinella nelsoni]|uniref:Protein Star n=1 Tax=Trichinella nelsoni TaxID=6336 RepID=A0A0V0S4E8_9BILA|nr:Protein Star [Trichinella nelsoni]